MVRLDPNIKVIGRREYVNFPQLNISNIEAKIDTGAYTCSIHCKQILLKTIYDKTVLSVQLLDNSNHTFENFTKKKIKNSFGEMEERYIIKTLISIGRKKINTT